MREITKKWVELSQADLIAAQTQFRYGPKKGSAYQIAVFHCHQAIEKTLKAYLVEKDIELRKTHDITYLRALTGLAMPEKIMAFIDTINPHYLFPRYPDLPFKPSFVFTYNRKNVSAIIAHTKQVTIWFENILTQKK